MLHVINVATTEIMVDTLLAGCLTLRLARAIDDEVTQLGTVLLNLT